MLRRILLAVVFFILMFGDGYAQREAENWCFGDPATGWSFKTNPPSSFQTASPLNAFGRYACISDKYGKLKAYFDGYKIYNANNTLLINGNFFPYNTASDFTPVIFVPSYIDTNILYLFYRNDFPKRRYCYAIIDLNTNKRKGEVLNQKVPFSGKISTSYKNGFRLAGLSATRHADNKSFWIVTGEKDSTGHFIATYKLGMNGLNNNPVKNYFQIKNFNFIYALKFSPDKKTLLVVTMDTINSSLQQNMCNLILFNFDNSNGYLSKIVDFDLSDIGGIEFSPDGNKLYLTCQFGPQTKYQLYQLDLSIRESGSITSSLNLIYSPQIVDFGDLQLAPNNKIYISGSNNFNLHLISEPNKLGINCDVQTSVYSIRTIFFPTFVQSFFYVPQFEVNGSCLGDTTEFVINDTIGIDSVVWHFDDSLSFLNNSSRLWRPTHIFTDTGNYHIELIVYNGGDPDTTFRDIRIGNYPNTNFIIDTSVQCVTGNLFTFYDSSNAVDGELLHEWDFGDNQNGFFDTVSHSYNDAGFYNVKLTATSIYGCESSTTKRVQVVGPAMDFTINDTAQCFRYNLFNIVGDTVANPDSVFFHWYLEDSLISTQENWQKSFDKTGSYTIGLYAYIDSSCYDSLEKNIHIWPNPKSSFYISDTAQCFNQHKLITTNHSTIVYDTIVENIWVLDTIESRTPTQINAYKFPVYGIRNIQLITRTNHGCTDTFSKKYYVNPSPLANFRFVDSVQCFKQHDVVTQNLTTVNGDSLQETKWILNNDTIISYELRNYRFPSPRQYFVQMIATTTNQCSDTTLKYIMVYPSPNSVFTMSDSAQCFYGHSLSTTNNSYIDIGTITKTTWLMNGKTFKQNQISNYKFQNPGTYPISLISESGYGCSDTNTQTYQLNPEPKADFSVNDATQCFNTQILDARNSSLVVGDSITKNLWYLDQDTLNSKEIIGYKFDNFGTYPVKLVVATSNDCKIQLLKMLKSMNAPIADFSINDSSQCFNENNFKLTNQSQFSDLSKLNHWWDLRYDHCK
jgi:PKD repeat protein